MRQEYRSLCIQGNIPALYERLSEDAARTQTAKTLKRRYEERFYSDPPKLRYPVEDQWIRDVLRAYYVYFIQVLTARPVKQAEIALVRNLSQHLGHHHDDLDDLDLIESHLKNGFQKRGYQFLGGNTGPFRGPYIWRETTPQVYDVELPLRDQSLSVHFMHDFILHSWMHFASFGAVKAGGWAKDDGLYCDYQGYKNVLQTEQFTISYLKHEAQHVLDYEMFPKLGNCDLEYRAKLVELMYRTTHRAFFQFLREAKNDRGNGHVYAAYVIAKQFSEQLLDAPFVTDATQWKRVSVTRIQELATQLYQAHTAALEAKGNDTVTGLI